MKQLSTRVQIIPIIGHCMAFNNEKKQCTMVSYKLPRHKNVKQFKQENQRPNI